MILTEILRRKTKMCLLPLDAGGENRFRTRYFLQMLNNTYLKNWGGGRRGAKNIKRENMQSEHLVSSSKIEKKR